MTSPTDEFVHLREAMVEELRVRYRIRNERVLTALRTVRRHRFIPEPLRGCAAPYADHPCPIGYGQTVSQPYIVAHMTEFLDLQPGEKVLEIGTGSGYQAAILASMGAHVYTVERIVPLAEHALRTLRAEGFAQVRLRWADGFEGWPEEAPFDAIIATCAPDAIPSVLTAQLAETGRMVLPVGSTAQHLVFLHYDGGRLISTRDIPVRFVPMLCSTRNSNVMPVVDSAQGKAPNRTYGEDRP